MPRRMHGKFIFKTTPNVLHVHVYSCIFGYLGADHYLQQCTNKWLKKMFVPQFARKKVLVFLQKMFVSIVT